MSELEKQKQKYNEYYRKNKKHIKYQNVRENLALMKEQIAVLEYQFNKQNG